jgi:hypothetical protein
VSPFFRKKPVVIEAHRFEDTNASATLIVQWSNGMVTGPFDADSQPYLLIETSEGVMRADVGDWIVRGVAHEYYPVKSDIFGVTYEEVDG